MSAKKDEMLIRVSSAQIGCLVFRKSNHEKTRNERKNGTKKDMLGKISSYLSVSIWRRRMMFGSLGALAGFGYYYFVGCYSGTCPITGNPYISTIYGAAIGLLMVNGNRKEATKSKGAENGTGQTI
jgi:hypothetical protein